jgi:hypothetical protein
LDTATAAAGTATVLGVGGTVNKLLLTERHELAAGNSNSRLHSFGSAESPARTAAALVLDSTHDRGVVRAPVNRSGKSRHIDVHVGKVAERVKRAGHAAVVTLQHSQAHTHKASIPAPNNSLSDERFLR